MFMVIIILTSFGSFLYVANRNLVGIDNEYISTYFDIEFIDSIISVYMIGFLGNFHVNRFRIGYGKQFIMFMFFACSFFVSVVFMNMIINIMQNTFNNCAAQQVENGLREQIGLIDDHVWLVDIEKMFIGQKYILRIAPLSQEWEEPSEVNDSIDELKNCMEQYFEKFDWAN